MNRISEIDIVPYEDMATVDDQLMSSMASMEREWWGSLPFGEYLACTDPECRTIHSIEYAYENALYPDGPNGDFSYVPLTELEKKYDNNVPCRECGADTTPIFHPDKIIPFLKHYYSSGVFGALAIDQNENVVGTASASLCSLDELFESVNYKKKYNREHWMTAVTSILGPDFFNTTEPGKIINYNRSAVSLSLRKNGLFFGLTKATLNQHPEYDNLPTGGETRLDSLLYPVLKVTGYVEAIKDDIGSITTINPRIGNLRSACNFSHDEFKSVYGNRLDTIRRMQKIAIQETGVSNIIRKYTGVDFLE